MIIGFDHVVFFVKDFNKYLHLFKDILGFEVGFKVERYGGPDFAKVVGLPDIELDAIYLMLRYGNTWVVDVELVRQIKPPYDENPVIFPRVGGGGMTFLVDDIDDLHKRLAKESWPPQWSVDETISPGLVTEKLGSTIKRFLVRTEDEVIIEFFQPSNLPIWLKRLERRAKED